MVDPLHERDRVFLSGSERDVALGERVFPSLGGAAERLSPEVGGDLEIGALAIDADGTQLAAVHGVPRGVG